MTRTSRWARLVAALPFLVVSLAWAQDKPFGNEQLDQMLAPIALYPDSLLSQVLMASTYPAQVSEAVQWSKANSKQTGDAAVKAVESKGWDPAVSSLVGFPQALAMMGEKPDWVQNVGDAFLAQPEDVMNSVQRLRAQAQKAGNLKTTEQQKVIVEPAPQAPTQQVIVIEPAQPQVVYVPAYNPTVVYGPWPYPAYPPYYWPTPGYVFGSALMSGIAFGTGIAITNALWGGFDWGRNDVNINVNRYNNVNVNRQLNASQTNWQHNAANRKGVPYRDQASRQKFDQKVAGAENREQFRGKDPGRDAQRQQAQAALQQRGADPAKGREQLKNDPQARDRAQAAAQGGGADRARAAAQDADRDRARQAAQNRGGGDNALRGAGNAAQTRQQVDRGNASRQVAQQHARPQAASAGGRAGGGGGGARAAGGGRAGR
jgi:hypothetical protein